MRRKSLDINDLHDVRFVRSVLLVAVDANDLVTGLDHVVLLGNTDDHLDNVVTALIRVNAVAPDTTDDLQLLDDLLVARAGKNWDGRSVLADKTSHRASVSDHNDQVEIEIKDSLDGSGSHSLSSAERAGGVHLDVRVGGLVVDATLSLSASAAHDGDGVDRVVTVSRLTREHDGISAIKDGISNVGSLSTSRARSLDHGLKHLGGSDNGLGSNVSLLDHPLLSNEDLFGGNLHAQVTTGDHDTISGSNDLVVVVEALLVLDLGNDLDMGATGAEDLTDGFNALSGTDERSSDHVNATAETKIDDISLILLGESGEINDSAGEVHVLSLTNASVIHALNFNRVLKDLSNLASEGAISDVDSGANGDSSGQLLVSATDTGVVTLNVGVGNNFKVLTSYKVDGLVLQETSADFGTLGVEHDSDRFVGALLESLLQVKDGLAVGLVVTVGEVEAGNVHTGVNHFDEHVNVPARGSKGADNFGAALGNINALEDVGELDAGGVLAHGLGRVNHCFG